MRNNKIGLKVWIICVCAAWSLFTVTMIVILKMGCFEIETLANFGDSFGVFNALFSGLAFALLIYTANIQRKDLEVNKKDLELTRGEIKGQSEVFRKQAFESTFFNMVKMYNEIIESFHFEHSGSHIGRRAIEVSYRRFINRNDSSNGPGKRNLFQSFIEGNEMNFSYSYKVIFNILNIIKEEEVENKQRYIGILKGAMSHTELVIFNEYCNSEMDVKVKVLVKELNFLNEFTELDKDGAEVSGTGFELKKKKK